MPMTIVPRSACPGRSSVLRLLCSAAFLFSALVTTSVATAQPPIQLIGIGTVSGIATDMSNNHTLYGGVPGNQLGGFGSGIAYTGVANSYSAVVDSGPNTGSSLADNTTAYPSRVESFTIAVDPSTGTVTPNLTATTLLTNQHGSSFTGLSSSFVPGQPSSDSDNTRLDAEAIRVSNDGTTYYVSDEYGPDLYGFSTATGQRTTIFNLPSSLAVANPNAIGSNEDANNTIGRQSNKGMEGLAITPDGKTLVGIMQSPLLQDHPSGGINDRIVTVDIATGTVHEFLYQLHSSDNVVSEITAVNGHQFLVDERDTTSGIDIGGTKELYLIDTQSATDLMTTAYANGGFSKTATPSGVTPVSATPFLNLLDSSYGLNNANLPKGIEGVTFGPDLPNGDHLLLVTSDNNFSNTTPTYIYAFDVPASSLPGYTAQQFTVPEPGSWALWTLGSLGLLCRWGFQRTRRHPRA